MLGTEALHSWCRATGFSAGIPGWLTPRSSGSNRLSRTVSVWSLSLNDSGTVPLNRDGVPEVTVDM